MVRTLLHNSGCTFHTSDLVWSNSALSNRPPWGLPDGSVTDWWRAAKPSRQIHTLGTSPTKRRTSGNVRKLQVRSVLCGLRREGFGHRWKSLPGHNSYSAVNSLCDLGHSSFLQGSSFSPSVQSWATSSWSPWFYGSMILTIKAYASLTCPKYYLSHSLGV